MHFLCTYLAIVIYFYNLNKNNHVLQNNLNNIESFLSDSFFLALAITLLSAFVIQLGYYLFFYLRIFSQRPFLDVVPDTQRKPAISVIISARNEQHNLQQFLESVLTQEYPNYEVIVINDASEDDSETILAQLKLKYKHLYVTSIAKDSKFTHNKKLALTIGIKAAKHEWLAFTDADCQTVSAHWLAQLQKKFDDNTQIVLGYGGYQFQKGLLNLLIRFETMFIALQYFTFEHAGMPYMGVGRNLAYRKELFVANQGFKKHAHIASGDDDLFVNKHATGKNTKSTRHPLSFTRSVPHTSWKRWFQQKKRHYTTAKLYKPKHQIVLALEPLSRMLFYLTMALILAFYPPVWLVVLTVFGIRFLLQIIIFNKAANTFNEKNVWLFGFLLDILFPIINFMLYFVMAIERKFNKQPHF